MASPAEADVRPSPKTPSDGVTFANVHFEGDGHAESDAGASKSDNESFVTASEHEKTESSNIITTKDGSARKFQIHDVRPSGPSIHFNSTKVQADLKQGHDGAHPTLSGVAPSTSDSADQEITVLFRACNTPGRGSKAVPLSSRRRSSMAVPVSPRGGTITMRLVFPLRDVGANLLRMFSVFPYWDMAFWSGWSYSIGSILFVIDGAWSWGPLLVSGGEFAGEETYGVPLCFLIGALFYEVGATMAYFEAINDGSFAGSALRRFLQGHEGEQKRLLDEKIGEFFGHMVPGHTKADQGDTERQKEEEKVDPEAGWNTKDSRRRPGLVYQGVKRPPRRRGGVDYGEMEEGEQVEYVKWRWWPTWHRLRTHHIYEIGYLSCAVQLFGATVYGMCGVVILPGILSSLSQWQTNAAYWIPQIVASVCFVVASLGFTLETQEKWYRPEPGVLGWWIGVWAVVGSAGFL